MLAGLLEVAVLPLSAEADALMMLQALTAVIHNPAQALMLSVSQIITSTQIISALMQSLDSLSAEVGGIGINTGSEFVALLEDLLVASSGGSGNTSSSMGPTLLQVWHTVHSVISSLTKIQGTGMLPSETITYGSGCAVVTIAVRNVANLGSTPITSPCSSASATVPAAAVPSSYNQSSVILVLFSFTAPAAPLDLGTVRTPLFGLTLYAPANSSPIEVVGLAGLDQLSVSVAVDDVRGCVSLSFSSNAQWAAEGVKCTYSGNYTLLLSTDSLSHCVGCLTVLTVSLWYFTLSLTACADCMCYA